MLRRRGDSDGHRPCRTATATTAVRKTRAMLPTPMTGRGSRRRRARPRPRAARRSGSGRRRAWPRPGVRTVFGRTGSPAVAGDDVDAMSPDAAHQLVRRPSRAAVSNQRERCDLPMTIWVTLCARAKADHLLGDASAGRAWSSPRRRAARRAAASRRCGRARASVRAAGCAGSRHRAPSSGACSRSAMRLAARTRPGSARLLADADEHALAGRPRPGDGMRPHVGEHLLVDALGGAAQRQLAQRREVAGREVVVERALGLLAGHRPCPPRRRWIRSSGVRSTTSTSSAAVEDRVGHRLAHADAGDLGDHVVQALDVLDVDRRVDVDAGGEQLLDVEIALGMPAARRVGVGELVDQHELRPALQDRRRGPSPRAMRPL